MKLKNRKSIFYHRTSNEEARFILESGFKNSSGYYLGNRTWTGVWLSAIPGEERPQTDDRLLKVKLELTDRELSRWEWMSEGRGHREWLLPAGVINKLATVEVVDQFDSSSVAA